MERLMRDMKRVGRQTLHAGLAQVLAGEEEVPKVRLPVERRHLFHHVQFAQGTLKHLD